MQKEALTEKQKAFCREYIIDHNASRAYKAAYPSASIKAAESSSARLLKNVKVRRYISKLEKGAIDKLDFTLNDILRELGYIAFSDATNYTEIMNSEENEPHVGITETNCLTDGQKRAISQIKSGQFGVEIKTHDKVRALTELLRHYELAQQSDGKNKEVHILLDGGVEKWAR